jgi:formylglycine-generating enzyme required for sulfatase activity
MFLKLNRKFGIEKSDVYPNDSTKKRRTISTKLLIGVVSLSISLVSFGQSQNQTFTVKGVSFEMIYVQGGSFNMGCISEQSNDCEDDTKPVHRVTLSDYYIGKFEVTQELWNAVMSDNSSSFKGDRLPVEKVSWNDAQEFISKLNVQTGKQFRLPTEAEWEYAARGGVKSSGYKFSGSNDINAVAWYKNNSGDRTHDVGGKQPNELGIYDMSGNVWEWCGDWYNEDYYSSSPSNNPVGASSGSYRVLRGGSWGYEHDYLCVVSHRSDLSPEYCSRSIGFRIVLP